MLLDNEKDKLLSDEEFDQSSEPYEAKVVRKKMLFDEALEVVGSFGTFQTLLIIYLVVFVAPLRVLPLSAHIFTLLVPPHWCANPILEERFNYSSEAIRNFTVPYNSIDEKFSQCEEFDVDWSQWDPTTMDAFSFTKGASLRSCRLGWAYDYSLIYPTVVSEQNWVCENTWKAYIANSVFFACMSIGVLIFGALGDRFGRVPIMMTVYILSGISGLMTYFSNDFYSFIVTRIIQGLVLLTISITPFVLAVEYVSKQKRMLVLTAFRFAYPLIGACAPWVAYLTGHWRTLNILAVVPCIIAPMVSWFIPESTRWLISKGRNKKTKAILMKIARVNGRHIDESTFDTLEFATKENKTSPADMLRYPRLRRNFISTLFLWLCSCLTYSAGQLYAATATDDPFLMSSATNVVDIFATAVALPLADHWGRKPSMFTSYGLAGISYILICFVPDIMSASFALLMIGRFMQTVAYNVGYLYAAEVYPTQVRSQAMSIRQAFGSLGKFLSSQVTMLAFYSRLIPLFILGALSVFNALIVVPLPETLNETLPETLDDGENMRGNGNLLGCRKTRSTSVRGRSMSAVSAATVESDSSSIPEYRPCLRKDSLRRPLVNNSDAEMDLGFSN